MTTLFLTSANAIADPVTEQSVVAAAESLAIICSPSGAGRAEEAQALALDRHRDLIPGLSTLGSTQRATFVKDSIGLTAKAVRADPSMKALFKGVKSSDLAKRLGLLSKTKEVIEANPQLLPSELSDTNDDLAFLCEPPWDFDKLRDSRLAALAIQVDPDSARLFVSTINKRLAKARKQVSKGASEEIAALQWSGLRARMSNAGAFEDSAGGGAEKVFAPPAAGAATGIAGEAQLLVAKALGGLAKLIEDRAKQESIGWALDLISEKLCGVDADATNERVLAAKEVRERWFRNTCALASRERAGGYGVGSGMVDALVGALRSDLEALPGTASGFVVALGYGRTLKPPLEFKGFLEGHKGAGGVRDAVEAAVKRLREGATWAAMAKLSDDIDRANRPKEGGIYFYSRSYQVMACGLAMPAQLDRTGALGGGLSSEVRADQVRVGVLSGLTRPAACWRLVGKGLKRETYRAQLAAEKLDSAKWTAELAAGADVERLSSLIRLYTTIESAPDRVLSEVAVAQSALQQLKALSAKAAPPPVQVNVDGQQVSTPGDGRAQRIARAALQLSRASLGMAEASLELFERVCAGDACAGKGVGESDLRLARVGLDALTSLLSAVEALLAKNLGGALAHVLTMVERSTKTIMNPTATATASKDELPAETKHVLNKVGRWAGATVGLVQAETTDEAARALEAVASPIGGWRRKGAEGRFTLSLTAHPGFIMGGEFRVGQYGGQYLRGDLAGVAPAPAMPFGLELAWGSKCPLLSPFALYFPLIDPLAFLQYDASEGRLPGPSLLTVLSPGVGLRLGITETPFSIMPLFLVRPGLRQWKAGVSEPAATAYQFGVAFTVDVTLFDIYQEGAEP